MRGQPCHQLTPSDQGGRTQPGIQGESTRRITTDGAPTNLAANPSAFRCSMRGRKEVGRRLQNQGELTGELYACVILRPWFGALVGMVSLRNSSPALGWLLDPALRHGDEAVSGLFVSRETLAIQQAWRPSVDPEAERGNEA